METKFWFVPLAPVKCTLKKWTIMKKKLPKFKTDEEAEAFVDEADLSQYDLSDMNPISFEF